VAPPLLGVAATVSHVQEILRTNLPEQVMIENRSVHGEHDVYYHAPLVPGAHLLVRGRLYGVAPRSSGTAVVSQVQLSDPDSGAVVHEQFFTNFLRRVMTSDSIGALPDPHPLPDATALGRPAAVTSYVIDGDQTYRYADASGDHSIYHLDDEAARAAGFAGIIVHGLCTMAFASRAVVEHACGGDPLRLRRLAVRFSRPLYPGHPMTTTLWSHASEGEGSHYFRVDDDEGAPVITNGLAEVGPTREDERSQ
jgi:acyl dehydratase